MKLFLDLEIARQILPHPYGDFYIPTETDPDGASVPLDKPYFQTISELNGFALDLVWPRVLPFNKNGECYIEGGLQPWPKANRFLNGPKGTNCMVGFGTFESTKSDEVLPRFLFQNPSLATETLVIFYQELGSDLRLEGGSQFESTHERSRHCYGVTEKHHYGAWVVPKCHLPKAYVEQAALDYQVTEEEAEDALREYHEKETHYDELIGDTLLPTIDRLPETETELPIIDPKRIDAIRVIMPQKTFSRILTTETVRLFQEAAKSCARMSKLTHVPLNFYTNPFTRETFHL